MKRKYVKPTLDPKGKLSLVTAQTPVSGGQAQTSDIRLKSDIEQVGVAANGLPLYNFRYFWSDAVYQGVMAQDVLKAFPEAVVTQPTGFMAVDYDMLGLEMKRVH